MIYVSQAVNPFERYELEVLESLARAKNARLDVTGMLCYVQSQFVQYLEGSAESLQILMASIEKDRRHRIIKRIDLPPIGCRIFKDWNLRYFAPNDIEAVFPNFLGFLLEFADNNPVLEYNMDDLLVSNLKYIASL